MKLQVIEVKHKKQKHYLIFHMITFPTSVLNNDVNLLIMWLRLNGLYRLRNMDSISVFGVLSYLLGKIKYHYCQFLTIHLVLQYILGLVFCSNEGPSGLVFCSNEGPSTWINFQTVSNAPWVHLRTKLSLNRITWVPHEIGSGRQCMP